MFLDIAPSEFLVIAAAAIIFIGPKDMPRAMRTAGRWMGKARRVSNHFRAGLETMIREAELAEMEKEWAAKNAAIMAAHPEGAVMSAEAMGGGAVPAIEAPYAEAPSTPVAMPALPEFSPPEPSPPEPLARKPRAKKAPAAPPAGEG